MIYNKFKQTDHMINITDSQSGGISPILMPSASGEIYREAGRGCSFTRLQNIQIGGNKKGPDSETQNGTGKQAHGPGPRNEVLDRLSLHVLGDIFASRKRMYAPSYDLPGPTGLQLCSVWWSVRLSTLLKMLAICSARAAGRSQDVGLHFPAWIEPFVRSTRAWKTRSSGPRPVNTD